MSESALNGFLDELVKSSLDCIGYMEENEEWKSMARRNNIEGSKKLRLATNSKLEVVEEELRSKEEELKRMEKVLKKVDINGNKTYVLSDQSEHEVSNELVLKYLGSWIYDNLIDLESRDGKKVDTGYPLKYFDEIVRYMGNEYDIWKLNGVEFVEFCRELMEIRIPIGMDIMKRLCNDYNEYGIRWKNRCVVVNGNEYKMIFDYMKLRLSQLKNNEVTDRIEYSIDDKYEPIIQSFSNYLQDKSKGEELRSVIDRKLLNSFVDEYPLDMVNKDVQDFFYPIYSPFLKESIINEEKYDAKLREWIGDYKWRLIYRSSEHGYRAKSFHEYCDNVKGPTLVIIKSSGGWIFGGYTTKSWNEGSELGCIYFATKY